MNTPPNRWKIAFAVIANVFAVVVVVTFCIIVYMGLQLFDQSATLDRDHDRRIEAALSVLRSAMPEAMRIPGKPSKNDIFAILKKHYPSAHIVSSSSTIEMDEIRFCFSQDGSLDRIEETDDYGTRDSDSPTNRDTIH